MSDKKKQKQCEQTIGTIIMALASEGFSVSLVRGTHEGKPDYIRLSVYNNGVHTEQHISEVELESIIEPLGFVNRIKDKHHERVLRSL
jgi:hypothetical protein